MTRVLVVRTDAIGDAILWAGAAEHLRALFPDATLGLLCRTSVAPLWEACPSVDDLLPIEYDDARFTDDQRAAAIDTINAWRPDLVLNPIRSKHPHIESVLAAIDAPEKICIEPDSANASADDLARSLAAYDRILPSAEATDRPPNELEHHAAFLCALGDQNPDPVRPRVFLTPADHHAAASLLTDLGLRPGEPIALFPAARWRYKHYANWHTVLRLAAKKLDAPEPFPPILILGGPDAAPIAAQLAADLTHAGRRAIDATARPPLRTTLALIAASRATVGVDTFAIHAACAQDIPNAVILGGAHPGRFLPYSPRTHAAMLPLDCFGCDWRCQYERAHCVTDVPPETVARAIAAAVRNEPVATPHTPAPDQHPFAGRENPAPAPAALRVPLTLNTRSGR